MSTGLAFACVVHDRSIAEANVLRSIDGLAVTPPPTAFILDNEANALGLRTARLYNLLLRIAGPSRRIFCHADVTFPPDFLDRVAAAIHTLDRAGTKWGALGMVGRAWDGSYTWSHEVAEPSPVCTLDSCCLIVDNSQGLAFDDATFDELHCYVEDYCLQCHSRNLGVYVLPAAFTHHSATYAELGSRWGRYPKYRRRLDRKWKGRFPSLRTT